MKIFSNFDTKLKLREYKRNKKEFGDSNVELVSKSGLFRAIFVDLPFFSWAFACLLLMYFFSEWFGRWGVLFGALPITILTGFFLRPKVIKHLVDYYMDFVIITPTLLYRYDQEWVITRHVITIHTNSIKSISIKKWGILYSIFDNWNIIFFTEWDEDQWEVTLTYIKDPETVRTKVSHIIKDTLE